MKIWLALLVGLWGSCLSQLPAATKPSELYAVKRVVEASKADSAAKAQELAKQSAMQRAFGILLKRLSAGSYKDMQINQTTLEGLVLSYSVEDERMSGKSYKAAFSFQFDPLNTKQFLHNHGLTLVERSAPRVLLIPVLRKSQDTLLWEDNPWFARWKSARPFTAIQPYALPKQDLFDSSTWPVTQYPNLLAGAAAALSAHYRASGIVVGECTLMADGAVKLRLLHYTKEGRLQAEESSEFANEKLETLLGHAVEQTQAFLETIGKRNESRISDSARMLDVHVPVNDVQQAKDILKLLHGVEGIQRIVEREIRAYEIVLGIVFRTPLPELQSHLRDVGYELRKRGDQVILRSHVKPTDREPSATEVAEIQASLAEADADAPSA